MSGTDQSLDQKHSSEDDDLFDFPLIELTTEGLREEPRHDSSTRPLETLSSVAAALPRETPSPASKPKISPAAESAPPIKMVTPEAAVPSGRQATAEATPTESDSALRQKPLLVIGALVALFILNGVGFWYLWRMRVSFGTGIDDLRNELDDASKRLERARRDAAAQSSSALMSDESIAIARVTALERSALVMAENEITGGDYGAARRRLNRLLAQADRMTPGLRAEIEPRAAYLVARSYLDEAQARRGDKQ
ncbi:MAG: hypothetical protein JNL28_09205 [Planctomycetes bacterium]|nr:hypothetical protein [Planctomycetota bacterium]